MISIKIDDFSANYDLFVKLCEITSEPLKLCKDGKSDLIVMNADAYERRKKMLDLREKLLRINEDDPLESKGISLEELSKYINELEAEVKG
ncbi:MAG: prevent-host-death protein [Ruminococcus sp.]|nr:prevent-host-death protein [Ruminococcus sp.]